MTRRSKKSAAKAKKQSATAHSDAATAKVESAEGNPYFKLGFIFLVAALFRFLLLEIKPVHFDEGINGHFVSKTWEEGFYRYDPTNFHGPLYFYVLQMAELLFGRSILAFRFINAVISLVTIYWIARHRRFFGSAALWAALVMAVSTGAVFYGRYAIHETLFMLCQILFSYGYFLWRDKRNRQSITFMVTGLIGSLALKETFFIFFGTWAIAIFCVQFYESFFGQSEKPAVKANPESGISEWLSQLSIGATAAIVLFTGAFLNRKGFEDMFAAFAVWSKTGTGNSGHEKPFMYWLELLWRYEWPSLVALVLTAILFFVTETRRRIVILVAFGTWLAYSIIPYKTPWLILNLLWPLAFVLGFGLQKAFTLKLRYRMLALVVLAIVLAKSAVATYELNFKNFADSQEPYVYVQSTNSMKHVMDLIQSRVSEHPEDLNMQVYLFVKDPWPFPWLFSLYPNLIYGGPDNVDNAKAGVILIDGTQKEDLEKKIAGTKFIRVPFQTRDSYPEGFAYFNFEKFKDLAKDNATVVEASTVEASR